MDDDYVLVPGSVGAFQFDLTRAEQEELEERLKRKRPVGFAPWPQEEGTDEQTVAAARQRAKEAGGKNAGKPRTRRRQ